MIVIDRKQRCLHWAGWLMFLSATSLGCGYKGAIYSSYQETGIGIRTTAESDAPVKVHFGYDRSVAAFVPRRGGDAKSEEATALISKDVVGANLNPTKTATANALTVDAAFITGTAAIVASAPADAVVTVCADNSACPTKEAPETVAASGTKTFLAQGSAGERIAMALTQSPGRLGLTEQQIRALQGEIAKRPQSDQNAIYDRAAEKMPQRFQAEYNSIPSSKVTRHDAFVVAANHFLKSEPDRDAALASLAKALLEASKGE